MSSEGELKKRIRERNSVFPIVCDLLGFSELEKILEDAKKVLGANIIAVINSYKDKPVSLEVKKLAEDFVAWFGTTKET